MNSNIQVFPNPVTSNSVTFDYSSTFTEAVLLRIVTSDGRLLSAKGYAVQIGSNKLAVDASSIPNGAYFIELISDGSQKTQQVPIRILR